MAMTYQKGIVYLSGKRIKEWYGKFLVYGKDQEGREVSRQRNIALCPKAGTPKWRAEQMLKEIILKECSSTEIPSPVEGAIASILAALTDLHDLCLLSIGIFCGPRQRGIGISVGILERRVTDATRYRMGRSPLRWSNQDQAEQASDPGTRTSSLDH